MRHLWVGIFALDARKKGKETVPATKGSCAVVFRQPTGPKNRHFLSRKAWRGTGDTVSHAPT